MAEIRNLTRNGETFYPLTHEKAVIGMEDFKDTITEQIENLKPHSGTFADKTTFANVESGATTRLAKRRPPASIIFLA